jgi:hypothetical protein
MSIRVGMLRMIWGMVRIIWVGMIRIIWVGMVRIIWGMVWGMFRIIWVVFWGSKTWEPSA